MLNVGDKVTIILNLEEKGSRQEFQRTVGYSPEMSKYAGEMAKIQTVNEGYGTIYYRLDVDEGNWMWTEEMFTETATKVEEEERPMVEHTAVERIDRDDVLKNMYETLDICDIYHPTDNGMNTILDEWAEKKGRSDVWEGNSVLDILSKHPDYVPEKGYIVKKNEYDRGVDTGIIQEVLSNLISALYYPVGNGLVDEVKLYPFTYSEVCQYKEKLRNIMHVLESDPFFSYRGMSVKEIREDYDIWRNRKNILDDTYVVENSRCYKGEDINNIRTLRRLIDTIKGWAYEQLKGKEGEELIQPLLIDDKVVKMIENSGLTIRGIRTGQKLNKVINKILAETGVKDRWSDYNRQIARLSDAASPLKFTKYTIISANPVDYWRMSFGKSWKSCQTIDKLGNYRPSDGGDGYEGMHASGTESYMLDPSSVVMYTVDEKYDGSDYEMEPKMERCMFHLGEGKFVMGRVYPQGTDGAKEVYSQWRAIFQQIIAECMGVPNYWRTEKEINEKLRQIHSHGTHYRDYEYNYCEIAGWSYLKPDADTKPSDRRIEIGSQPICPSCGRSHWEDDNIECECCKSGSMHECYDCGSIHDEEDMYYIDGEWYCRDCVEWCEYHQEYERDETTYVDNYGYVCEYALEESGEFVQCEHCGDWYYRDNHDGISTQDGGWYCCERCASETGYMETYDGEWYPEDEVYYCEQCGEYVHDDEWNDELEMCKDCAENLTATEEAIA